MSEEKTDGLCQCQVLGFLDLSRTRRTTHDARRTKHDARRTERTASPVGVQACISVHTTDTVLAGNSTADEVPRTGTVMLLCVSWAVRRTYPHPSSLALHYIHYSRPRPGIRAACIKQQAAPPQKTKKTDRRKGRQCTVPTARQPPEACSKLLLLLTIPS